MKNLLLLIAITIYFNSCGKNTTGGNNKKRKDMSYVTAYVACHDSVSGYCDLVTFQVYGSDPQQFLCPVSNRYMETGKKAVVKKLYNSWTGRWYYGCDNRTNLRG